MNLTDKETKVASGLARGLTLAEIGAEIGMNPRTVKYHAERLNHRYGVEWNRKVPDAVFRSSGVCVLCGNDSQNTHSVKVD